MDEAQENYTLDREREWYGGQDFVDAVDPGGFNTLAAISLRCPECGKLYHYPRTPVLFGVVFLLDIP